MEYIRKTAEKMKLYLTFLMKKFNKQKLQGVNESTVKKIKHDLKDVISKLIENGFIFKIEQ